MASDSVRVASPLHFSGEEGLHGMTLILGATNGREIAVGADSFVYEGDGIGGNAYRSYSTPKLRLVNGGRWVIGFTRLGGVARNIWDYIEARRQVFDPDIRIGVFECSQFVGNMVQDFHLQADATELVAGFSGTEPRIYTWNITQPNIEGGAVPTYAGIGIGVNIGLYILDACRPFDDFDAQQLTTAVYFGIEEVIRMGEPRVGRPIDVAVISRDGASIQQRESLRPFELRSENLSGLIRKEILSLVAGV